MIIGLCGFAGSGKDTVANELAEFYAFNKLSFASNLKDTVSVMFSWPRHLLEGDTEESRTFREAPDTFWSEKMGVEFTPRYALTRVGTELIRNKFHTNFWVYSLERQLKTTRNAVITDVRFPNEIKMVKEQGGFIVRVIRGPEPEWYDSAWKAQITYPYQWTPPSDEIHSSEYAWIGTNFDYVIDNNGSKSDILPNLLHMMKVFTGPSKEYA